MQMWKGGLRTAGGSYGKLAKIHEKNGIMLTASGNSRPSSRSSSWILDFDLSPHSSFWASLVKRRK